MRKYIVYTFHGAFEVTSEKVEYNFMNNKATRLVFTTDDYIVAEFYCDRICGWMEKRE